MELDVTAHAVPGLLAATDRVPELQELSRGQHDTILYFLVVTMFALLASFLWSWTSRDEVGARYRPAVLASLCITFVATVSYAALVLEFHSGYDLRGGTYVPNPEALLTVGPRYMDWSVTVPLLTAELLAVCSLTGGAARRTRACTMTAAFLMILTGYIGAKVVDDGTNEGALWLWGAISTVFFVYLYVALIRAVARTLPTLSEDAAASLRNATIVLLSVFGLYPLVYCIQLFTDVDAAWLTTTQVAFCCGDVVAKVGFGALVHKVAKLRTAEDVAAGTDTHPEPVWVSGVRHSQGVQPLVEGLVHAGPVAPKHHHDGADDPEHRRHDRDDR